MHVRRLAALSVNKQQSLNGHGDAEKSSQNICLFELYSHMYNHDILSNSYKLWHRL